ncbi:hypothetical protein [Robbsia andropogonis]|uniref:hypothetical protein n=1 Tax=Robbsia andropogonis TaxID=28092 RepID=UPI0020A1D30C|nr:hypothetical protein [Robbsia andropogonis]MCP1119638.1 hypothetical protein [Robbsia andropogonis]MCP1129621.1 hypothetical protein [Robbsia andropogonis]
MGNITKEERERRAAEASAGKQSAGEDADNPLTDGDDDQGAGDTHVTMVRDPEQYAAPHRATVHRSEVRNYYPGGWEIEDVADKSATV